MSEIADFLRARIAERREGAETIHNLGCGAIRFDGTCDCGEPEAVIADCDAKLALVDEHPDAIGWDGDSVSGRVCRTCGEINHDGELTGDPYPCRTLRILAQPFAGHPDHKGEEWAP